MDLLKGILSLIVTAAEQSDIDIIRALLLFYLCVSAVLLLIKLVRGLRK